jgi:hypothetical protein
MTSNVLLESAIGAIPVAGDLFHVVWKANRRNYRLLIREKQHPASNIKRDWLFIILLALALLAMIATPIAILIYLLRSHPLF